MADNQSKLPEPEKKPDVTPADVAQAQKVIDDYETEYMEPQHWLVAGKRTGAGKTSLALALIFWLKKHVRAFRNWKILSPIPIYATDDATGYAIGYDPARASNPFDNNTDGSYHGNTPHPDWVPMTDWRMIIEAKDMFIFIDDIALLARARDWDTDKSKLFTKIAKNARANGCFMIYSAQRSNEPDIDLRFNFERVFVPVFRVQVNQLDKEYSKRLEEQRALPIDWKEYIPSGQATERFVFPWEEEGRKNKTLMINTENPIDFAFPLSVRPTWKQVQSHFDTRFRPTAAYDAPISEKYVNAWGGLFWDFIHTPDSYMFRWYIGGTETATAFMSKFGTKNIDKKDLLDDIRMCSENNKLPLAQSDLERFKHIILIRLDDEWETIKDERLGRAEDRPKKEKKPSKTDI